MFDILHCLFYKQYICQFFFFLSKKPPTPPMGEGPGHFFPKRKTGRKRPPFLQSIKKYVDKREEVDKREVLSGRM